MAKISKALKSAFGEYFGFKNKVVEQVKTINADSLNKTEKLVVLMKEHSIYTAKLSKAFDELQTYNADLGKSMAEEAQKVRSRAGTVSTAGFRDMSAAGFWCWGRM